MKEMREMRENRIEREIGAIRGRICRAKVWMASRVMKKEPGIDGILVTVGLCIIALLLCVVMKDSLTAFIQTIVTNMTERAQGILKGV
jgi:hypothetical protein